MEGAGASPSQRTGTRLGGVVSSRDCSVERRPNSHNRVKAVENGGLGRVTAPTEFLGKVIAVLTASAGWEPTLVADTV